MSKTHYLIKSMKRGMDRLFHSAIRFAFGLFRKVSTKTIMIVRTDGIGDFVFFARYVNAIQERYKGFRVVVCCRKETAALAKSIVSIDVVTGFNIVRCRRDYLYRLWLISRIRSMAPRIAVYASFHRENVGDELALFSGARETFAFSGNDECIHPSVRQRNNLEYSTVVEVPDHTPEKDKYAQLLHSLGCRNNKDANDANLLRHLRLPESSEQENPSIGIVSKQFAVIGPGGSGPIRRWPVERFSKLADHLASRFKLDIVLCGSQDERAILAEVARGMNNRAEICSSLDLMQVIAVLRKASVFVGNESGLLHLAASLNIPALGILGGGHFSRYFPYGTVRIVSHKLDCYECNWSCKFPEPYCITNISVDDVLAAFNNLSLHEA
jgi:ADP-heptose:LPS heptosyltransferase